MLQLSIAFGLLVAQSASAPPPQAMDDGIVTTVSLDTAKCNLANSTTISFDDAMQKPDILAGKWVAVTGYWMQRAIFRSREAANSEGSNFRGEFAQNRLGVYASKRLLYTAPKRARPVVVSGIIKKCETAWPGAIMVMGYCHYTNGPFIIISQVQTQR